MLMLGSAAVASAQDEATTPAYQPDEPEVMHHAAEIATALREAWVKPSEAPTGLQALVRIELSRHGDVRGTEIVESSGHEAFDDAVERAAYRAAPLPMPEDEAANEALRERTYRFAPDR